MRLKGETYLGDGLYASCDGFQITLRAPREFGDHFVALEPAVLEAFQRFVKDLRGEPVCTCNADEANRAAGNHFGDCPLR